MKLEDIALPIYRDGVEHCENDLIKQVGIQNYIQLQSAPVTEAEG